MIGARKEFDADKAELSEVAERELRTWLRKHGYQYTHTPHGRFGIDGQAENDTERFAVEVERTEPARWLDGDWPQPDVRVLERRIESMRRSNALLFVVRSDVRRAMVVFPQSLIDDRLRPFTNKYKAGEFACNVPVYECCPVELDDGGGKSIAEINAERIRREFHRALTAKTKLALLQDAPPYGMCEDEWRELRRIAEQPIRQKALCDCKRIGSDAWIESGTDARGWPRVVCKHCGAFKGYREPARTK